MIFRYIVRVANRQATGIVFMADMRNMDNVSMVYGAGWNIGGHSFKRFPVRSEPPVKNLLEDIKVLLLTSGDGSERRGSCLQKIVLWKAQAFSLWLKHSQVDDTAKKV